MRNIIKASLLIMIFLLTGCSGGSSVSNVYTPYDTQSLVERDNTVLNTESSILGVVVRFPANVFDSDITQRVAVRFPYPSDWEIDLEKDETYDVLRTDKEKYQVWYNITEKDKNSPVLAVARTGDMLKVLFYEDERLIGERDYTVLQSDIDSGSINIDIYVL
ncbi:MAG: hypothetical protein C0601_07595 [Candidatus Muiribacterium halophilum]|uniref:Lipoprotein n=1 Tax=Muiribacterium halophilum TaxID=2053465 RepID=A0A2N5ZFF0_MUIH1|nr:MAG: hypothetical protein C0601_07595 [Candidatus Muirbacterium halophilum]